MLSGRTPQISLSLCRLCFFTPWYWSGMKAREGAHLQLNLILHRQKSKIVHVKKARKELSFFFFFAGDQTFHTMLLKNTILLVQPLQTPQAKPDDCSSYPKLIKEPQKPILGLQLKFCACIKTSNKYGGKRKKKNKKKRAQLPQTLSFNSDTNAKMHQLKNKTKTNWIMASAKLFCSISPVYWTLCFF